MAVKLRLARYGAKKRPYYWLVASDSRSPRDGAFLAKLGTYNPLLPKETDDRFKVDVDKVSYWLSVGAQPTTTVARYLKKLGLKVS